uniref:Uncharacterized protein n=1 Tax=Romanomermis culicivorax TaxID=13658 RepID=A0A915JK43_ROMCU
MDSILKIHDGMGLTRPPTMAPLRPKPKPKRLFILAFFDGTDRQQFETCSLKIHFRSERMIVCRFIECPYSSNVPTHRKTRFLESPDSSNNRALFAGLHTGSSFAHFCPSSPAFKKVVLLP